ncbi:MAG TPA: hypothetical protein VG123_24980 [Streptosporangiaceae bacterium]|nr:hypothetical protein [Streptosporangiaceae bacterium]
MSDDHHRDLLRRAAAGGALTTLQEALHDVLASHLAEAHVPAGPQRHPFADQASITPHGRAVREETTGSGEDAA